MKRIFLSNSKKWFDLEKAEYFKEGQRWDGNNWISKTTGEQLRHLDLYLTKSGKWVLNYWSQWQKEPERYVETSEVSAIEWFSRSGYKDDEIPECLLPRYIEVLNKREI